MILEFFVSAIFMLILWYALDSRKNPYAPPGPLKFPLVGNLIQIAKAHSTPYLAFHKLAQKYGPVISLQLGASSIVLLSSYDAMKDILTREEAAGRDLIDFVHTRSDNKDLGIIFTEGKTWRTLRSYTISTLKEYGYGNRSSMEDLISDELQDFISHLKNEMSKNNGVVESKYLFQIPVLNVLWRIIAGKQIDYTDKAMNYLVETTHRMQSESVLGAGLLTSFPFLKYIAPNATGFNMHKKICSDWRKYFKDLLDQRREDYNKTKEVNCYIDSFIQKIDETSDDPKSLFTDEQFVMCALDLFQAGSDTTGSTMGFAFLFMILRPDVQKKIQKELESVVGNRKPQLVDRNNMSYTQATILEIFRWARTTALQVPRKATKDIFYKNWTIKEGTAIYTNVHPIYFDEDFWGDPHIFRPERFLDSNEKIISEKAERIVAFGAGKRVCPGEPVARDTIFLFLTSLLQKFSFGLPPGDEKPSTEPVLGYLMLPPAYRALLKER